MRREASKAVNLDVARESHKGFRDGFIWRRSQGKTMIVDCDDSNVPVILVA